MVIALWPLTGEKKKALSRLQIPFILDTAAPPCYYVPMGAQPKLREREASRSALSAVNLCRIRAHSLSRSTSLLRLIKRDFRKPMRTLAFTVLEYCSLAVFIDF